MTGKLTRKGATSALALMAVLAAAGAGYAAMQPVAAAAAPASQSSADHHPSEWSEASDFALSGKTQGLTGNGPEPEGGSALQLAVGFGLMAVGLISLACALTLKATRRRSSRARPLSTASLRRPGHPPARSGAPS